MKLKNPFRGLSRFLILWSGQALSGLGSSMTSYALVIWAYQRQGSALTTALLSICTYAPYILLSLFAGAFVDRLDKKKTMLLCDSVAAAGSLMVLLLLSSGRLEVWHLYLINTLNGLMNVFQNPAAETAVSLLAPKEQYNRVSGLQSFSNSLVTMLCPAIATALLAFGGMELVLAIDLGSFLFAFLSLGLFIRIPRIPAEGGDSPRELLRAVGGGMRFLRDNQGVLRLIFFLAAINLIASVYNAALAPMILSRDGGGQAALGWVTSATGLANIIGSALVALLPAPKNRVKIIFLALFISMSTENFLLAFGRGPAAWCIGGILGWLCIPFMNANMSNIMRTEVPLALQGRVFAARNTLQFFTIPVGYLLGGLLVDQVFEPFMDSGSPLRDAAALLVGTGKGSGAALLFSIIGIAGVAVCLLFVRDKHIWAIEKKHPENQTDS